MKQPRFRMSWANTNHISSCQDDWQAKTTNDKTHCEEDGQLEAGCCSRQWALHWTFCQQGRNDWQHVEDENEARPPKSVKVARRELLHCTDQATHSLILWQGTCQYHQGHPNGTSKCQVDQSVDEMKDKNKIENQLKECPPKPSLWIHNAEAIPKENSTNVLRLNSKSIQLKRVHENEQWDFH